MIYLYIILIFICIYILFIIYKSYQENEFGMFWYNFFKIPLGLIFKLYYPYKVVGKKEIPSGSLIIASNHIHLMDQCLAILEINRPIHYMAKIEYFNNYKTRWFFKNVGCIPVNREIHDELAKSMANDVLNKGLVLGIFPEGTRNKTKKVLLPFKYGAVSMAKKRNAYILPIAIVGTYKFRTKDLKIIFGTPYKITSDDIVKENEKLYNIIHKMIKEGMLPDEDKSY